MLRLSLKCLLLIASISCLGLTGCGNDSDKGKNADMDRPAPIQKK